MVVWYFEMNDFEEASYILGIKIIKNEAFQKLSISQETCINIVLSKFKMDKFNDAMIPYDRSKKLENNDYPLVLEELDELEFSYASAMGSLKYALVCTHLDLAFAMNILSRFQSNLGKNHWEAVK